jgi:hypothetical protein
MAPDPHEGGRLEDMAVEGTKIPDDAGTQRLVRETIISYSEMGPELLLHQLHVRLQRPTRFHLFHAQIKSTSQKTKHMPTQHMRRTMRSTSHEV